MSFVSEDIACDLFADRWFPARGVFRFTGPQPVLCTLTGGRCWSVSVVEITPPPSPSLWGLVCSFEKAAVVCIPNSSPRIVSIPFS